MVRRLRLALLIVAAGVTIYIIFPAMQTQLASPGQPVWLGGSLFHQSDPVADLAALQRIAWLDFARVEVIVVVAAAALWVLMPLFAQSLTRQGSDRQ